MPGTTITQTTTRRVRQPRRPSVPQKRPNPNSRRQRRRLGRAKQRATTQVAPKKRTVRVAIGTKGMSRGSSRLAVDVAAAIANPLCCPNLRIKPDAASDDRTAVIQLHAYTIQKQNTLSTAAVYSNILTLGQTYVALFRDLFRSYIVFTANPTNSPYSYTVYTSLPNGSGSTSTPAVGADASFFLAPLYLQATTTYAPHDTYLFTGTANGVHWLWMDLGATMTFTQSAATASTLYAYLWDGEDTQSPFAVGTAFAGGSAVFTCTQFGYYNFEVVNGGAAYTLTTVYAGSSETFSHHASPGVFTHLSVLNQHRVDATSIMISPICPEMAKNGALVAAWVPPTQSWTQNVTFNTEATFATAREFRFATGAYGFIKPSQIADFKFVDEVSTNNGNVCNVGFDLKPSSKYLAFAMTVDTTLAAGVPISANGLEFLLSFVTNVEFVTNDQWHEMHLPGVRYTDVQEALELLSGVEPFHENPLHWKEIWSAIKTGYNGMRRHAGTISTAMSAMFPEFAAPLKAGGAFLSTLPEAS